MHAVQSGGERIGFADAREFAVGGESPDQGGTGLSAVDRMMALTEGAGIDPVVDLSLHVPADAEEGDLETRASG